MLRTKWDKGPYLFKGPNMTQVYPSIMDTMILEGEWSAPRGLRVTELLHATTRLQCPRERVFTVWGRKTNPFFALAEVVWILAGSADAKWLTFYNSRLTEILDSNAPRPNHFQAPYGERIRRWGLSAWRGTTGSYCRDQLRDCYDILVKDPESRQAVISLWNPDYDHPGVVTKDRPCNDAIAFKVRDGRLFMSVFNRSNDLVFGLSATNQIQFSVLQEVLASWLGVEPGPYTHYSDSLHVYDTDPFAKRPVPKMAVPFRLYDYVKPVAMETTDPAKFDAMIAALFQAGDPNAAPAPLPYRVLTEDPFWGSAAFAMRAWQFHKAGKSDEAVSCLSMMEADDWFVECCRFFVDSQRFAGNKGAFIDLIRQRIPDARPVLQYVYSDPPLH